MIPLATAPYVARRERRFRPRHRLLLAATLAASAAAAPSVLPDGHESPVDAATRERLRALALQTSTDNRNFSPTAWAVKHGTGFRIEIKGMFLPVAFSRASVRSLRPIRGTLTIDLAPHESTISLSPKMRTNLAALGEPFQLLP